jgi:hypothetical protein
MSIVRACDAVKIHLARVWDVASMTRALHGMLFHFTWLEYGKLL